METMMPKGRLFCFGLGYSAMRLAHFLLAGGGWDVAGTTRSREKAATAHDGLRLHIWPSGPIGADVDAATHILVSIAPTAHGDIAAQWLGDRWQTTPPRSLKWLGYLSTTAVYGSHDGAWVDEETPVRPTTERGIARVAAETTWQDLVRPWGIPLNIFRLAGIYGPGRGPIAQLQRGRSRRIIKEGQVFNRIHVDDIAGILHRSMTQNLPGGIYNVCDDQPERPEIVISHAASLLGLPEPPAVPFAKADLSPMARSFYSESKRVRNEHVKSVIGYALKFPDYTTGLPTCVRKD